MFEQFFCLRHVWSAVIKRERKSCELGRRRCRLFLHTSRSHFWSTRIIMAAIMTLANGLFKCCYKIFCTRSLGIPKAPAITLLFNLLSPFTKTWIIIMISRVMISAERLQVHSHFCSYCHFYNIQTTIRTKERILQNVSQIFFCKFIDSVFTWWRFIKNFQNKLH